MYRTALCRGSRPALRSLRVQQPVAPRRFASTSTSPADKPRSWKSSLLRWGVAGGLVYYYSTSQVFAEAPAEPITAPPSFADSDLPTVDSVLEEKRKQMNEKIEKSPPPKPEATEEPAPSAQTTAAGVSEGTPGEAAEALEGEADQQGAFNPETGEINWDCPCLGGMAHGPCGEEFKTAFSCFVFSEADPKGMDCIDKFQGMQTCFRKYPEIYGGELGDDDEDAPDAPAPEEAPASLEGPKDGKPVVTEPLAGEDAAEDSSVEDHQKLREFNKAHPKQWEDATDANADESKDEPKA